MSFKRGSSSSQQQQTVQPTEEETELNKLLLERQRAAQPSLLSNDQLALALSGQLLSGQGLPGNLAGLPGGINEEVTQQIVDDSLEDVATSAQFSGILDSGVAAELGARTSADIRTQSEQFNINNLLQLLNLALGSPAQVQAPIASSSQQLSQALAGLRGVTQTGRQRTSNFSITGQDVAAGAGGLATVFCWVAASIFGSWEHPKTQAAKFFVGEIAPDWFRDFYYRHGEAIAKFIDDKPVFKLMLRPLFEVFAFIGKKSMEVSYG